MRTPTSHAGDERAAHEGSISTSETAAGRWSPAAFSIRRPVTTMMVVVALCVLSAVAWTQIRMELLPTGFTPPFLFVQVPSLISSPDDVGRELVEPVEDALATLRGLERMESRASTHSATFLLQFRDGTPMDIAYNDVDDRLHDVVQEKQPEQQRYVIWKYNPSDDPLAWIGVSVPPGTSNASVVVERRLVPLLERVEGVSRVDVQGLPQHVVAVDVEATAVREIPGGLPMLIQRIQQAQVMTSGGTVSTAGGELSLRIVAPLDDMEQLRRLSIAPGVQLGDVASISTIDDNQEYVYRMNGKPGVFLSIYMNTDANVVETGKAVRGALARSLQEEPDLEGFGFHTFFDQGELIQTSLGQLQQSALIGGLLAMLCIFVFLRRFVLTLLVSLSIPACLLLTIAALYFTGGTLNVLSLTGMMLAVGMLVDNAIVVVEAIDVRHQEGANPKEAALSGTREVALPVTISTLTTLIVFLPLTLMNGNETLGFYLRHIGFPVGVGLIASLFVSLVLVPLVATKIFKPHLEQHAQVVMDDARATDDEGTFAGSSLSTRAQDVVPHEGRITRTVRRMTAWMLRRPLDAMVLIVLALASAWFPFQHVPRLDEMEPNLNDVRIGLRFDAGMTWEEKVHALDVYEGILLAHQEELELRDIRAGLGDIGIGGSALRVFLRDDAVLTRQELRDALRLLLPPMPGVQPELVHGGLNMNEETRPTLSIVGPDSRTLAGVSEEARRRLQTLAGVDAVLSSLKGPGDMLHTYQVDRERAMRAGVSPIWMMAAIDFALRGRDVGSLADVREGTVVRVRQKGIKTIEDVDAISVRPGTGVTVDTLANAYEEPSMPTIRRIDRHTQVELAMETQRKDVDALMVEAREVLHDMVMPAGYHIQEGGAFELMAKAGKEQVFALLLASIFVFLLVGILFESFLLPVAVLVSVPFAFAGVFWFLFVTGTSFDVMAAVGLLVLIGVVVNTAIVLVDYARLRERQGVRTEQALLDAVTRRLRPIAMTALTTIIGLIPMAVGRASIVGIPYAPLGVAVIGGLLASTVLSLFVVPLFYLLLSKAARAVRQLAL